MNTASIPDPKKDTSKPGREEEVIINTSVVKTDDTTTAKETITNLPVKNDGVIKETEGERRFKEGIANNTDSSETL